MNGERYLLDTDTCIGVLRAEGRVCARLRAESPEDIALSTMTEAELRYGALRSRAPVRNQERIDQFLVAPFAFLSFDRDAARCHAELRLALRNKPIGERDLVIASIAVAQGRTLVTGNTKEFGRVPKLKLANWLR